MSLELILQNKQEIIDNFLTNVQENHPSRIVNIDIHKEELNQLIISICNDLNDNTTINLQDLAANLWHKGDFLSKIIYAQDYIVGNFFDSLINKFPTLAIRLTELSEIFRNSSKGAPFYKKKYVLEDKNRFLEEYNNLAKHRYNYKPLEGAVNEYDFEIILNAANGITPALSNEYNYRVDEVPEHIKKDIYEQTKNFSEAAQETGFSGYAIDNNPQLLAPKVIVFSLRYNLDNSNIEQFCGHMTVRDPNIMNVGMCVWHTTMVAEALGYKTSFAQMTGWKREKCKELLGLTSDETQTEITLNRSGKYDFMPMIFLCIGSEGSINANTRRDKKENIVNILQKK